MGRGMLRGELYDKAGISVWDMVEWLSYAGTGGDGYTFLYPFKTLILTNKRLVCRWRQDAQLSPRNPPDALYQL